MKIDPVPYLLVAAGGFCGAVLRFIVDSQVSTLLGTLIVNTVGCVFMAWQLVLIQPNIRVFRDLTSIRAVRSMASSYDISL